MDALHALLAGLVPPLCAACGRGCRRDAALCARCMRRLDSLAPLAGAGPPGVDRAWSSAPHDGVARDLVAALKFRRLLPIAELMARRIEWLAPAALLSGALVPVPASPLRSLTRGFDPAAELAAALSRLTGLPVVTALARRDAGRQVGRRRGERLASPPRIGGAAEAPRSAVLVDDVLTTGATMSACAAALRRQGAVRIAAISFSRRL